MKNKFQLYQLPVFLTAVIAICRLTGLPNAVHITPIRILFIGMVLIGCISCMLFPHIEAKISRLAGKRAFIGQFCLLLAVISAVLLPLSSFLMKKEGILYSCGAFVQQAAPFLIFVIVLCLYFFLRIFVNLRKNGEDPLKVLFTESYFIPETMLIFIICMLVFGAFFPLRDNYYPSHDYAIFSYIGQQILRGKIPYTDLWDHKPPLIFYMNALGLKLAGGSLLGIWLLEFAFFFLGSVIFYRVLKHRFPVWISLPGLLLGILHYVRVLDFGNYTEELSLFFVLCTLGLTLSGKYREKSEICGVLCGIFCGLAFTSKQNTIGCWCALFMIDAITFFVNAGNADLRKKIIRFWLSAALGFLIVNAGWVIYFALKGALSAYWDVAFRFNFIYSEHSTESRLACAWTTLTFLPSVSPFLMLGFLSWPLSVIRIGKEKSRHFRENSDIVIWAVFALPIELIFAGLSGMNYQHYFILCIPPALVLLCSGLELLSGKINRENRLCHSAIIGILVIASLPLIRFFRDNYMPRTPSSYTKTRDFLLDETTADRPILVWGSRTAIYVMSSRYAPTAYFNERPLYLFPGSVQAAQWQELLTDLKEDPPQLIVYTHDSALPFVDDQGTSCSIPSMPGYTAEIYQYFCDNYQYEFTINPEFSDAWDIYRER